MSSDTNGESPANSHSIATSPACHYHSTRTRTAGALPFAGMETMFAPSDALWRPVRLLSRDDGNNGGDVQAKLKLAVPPAQGQRTYRCTVFRTLFSRHIS